jgi:hypothetical protein
MTKLEPITLGDHKVEISVEGNPAYPHVLFFSAICCGRTKIKNTHTHQGKHDHTKAQFDQDVQVHAERLASECAGRCQSTTLVAQIVKQ